MGKNRRKEAWELFLKSLERKPLLAYLQQQAPKQPQPAPAQPAAPTAPVPTSIVQQAQQAPSSAQPAPQAKPQQPSAQPAAPTSTLTEKEAQQPAPTSHAPKPQPAQPEPAAPKQEASRARQAEAVQAAPTAHKAPSAQQPPAKPAVPTSSDQQPAQAPKPASKDPKQPMAPSPAPTSTSSDQQAPAPTPKTSAPTAPTSALQQAPTSKLQQMKRIAERFRFRGITKVDVCPRCGGEGYEKIYTRKSKNGSIRQYVYVYHRLKGGGYYTCYLGPADDYVYVQKVHGDLALTHLRETNYAEVIAQAAEKYIKQLENAMDDEKKMDKIAHDIIDALVDLVELAKDSCESLGGKYREECLEELRAILS